MTFNPDLLDLNDFNFGLNDLNEWTPAYIRFTSDISKDGIKPTIKKKPKNIDFYPNNNNEIVRPVHIKNVRFSPPATIVFWSDGIKTVVKAQSGELYDAEKGLMACIIKRITGNTGKYNELFKKYIKENK